MPDAPALPPEETDPATIALAVAAALGFVAAAGPVVSWEDGQPVVSLPVLHAGTVSDRVVEALHSGSYALLGLAAALCLLAGPLRRVLVAVVIGGVFAAELLVGLAGLARDTWQTGPNAWLIVQLGAGSWSLVSVLGCTTFLVVAGARTVRPVGVAATVLVAFALLPTLVPASALFDVLSALTGNFTPGFDLARLGSYAVRPLVMLAALPVLLRPAPLSWWAAAWPLAFALSLRVTYAMRMSALPDPVYWIIGVEAIAGTAVVFVPVLLGRAWASARGPAAG